MVKTVTLVDALIDTIPGWSYVLLLMAAFLISLLVADLGFKAFAAVLQRMRRVNIG